MTSKISAEMVEGLETLRTVYDNRTEFIASSPDTDTNLVYVCGYTTIGDGGAHTRMRIATPDPVKPWHIQTADGSWWDLPLDMEFNAAAFGLGSGGVTTTSWETAASFITTRGGTLRVPAGTFILTNDWSVSNVLVPFKIIGAGMYATIFKRADTGTSAFWNIVNSSNYEISDLQLDCEKSNVAVGSGSHGLRMDRGENILITRIKVTDHTDTAIIYFDTANGEALHKNIHIIACEVDGISNANNGILLNNTNRGLMAYNKVINLGRQGAPQFAIQFKSRNLDGKSIGNWIENCRGGVAIGSDEVINPSNVNCHSSAEIIKGATRATRITYSQYCTIQADIVDMDEASDAGNPIEDTDEHAVFLNQVDNCVIHVKHLRGYEDTKYIIALPTAAGCTISIDTWRNVPQTIKFLQLGAGASGNVIEVKNYVGTRYDFPMDMVENNSSSQNTFRMGDDVMSQRTVNVTDTITILNPAITNYRLDTEAAGATDNLATINGGTHGQTIALTTTSDARDVVIKHNTGNIFLKGAVDRTLGLTTDIIMLMYNSFINKWLEI